MARMYIAERAQAVGMIRAGTPSDKNVTGRYKSWNMFYYLLLSAKYWQKLVFLSI